MAQLEYILQQFTIYFDGFGKGGTGESCNLPFLKKKMETYRGGGMIAARKVALGYEELTWEGDLSAYDPQVMGLMGQRNDAVTFSVAGYLTGDQGQQVRTSMMMRGFISSTDPGKWEAGKKAMLKVKCELVAVKLIIGAATIWDIDVENNVMTVNGVDEMAAIKTALGG